LTAWASPVPASSHQNAQPAAFRHTRKAATASLGGLSPLFCHPAFPDLIGSSTNILWTCVVFAFDEARPGVTEPEGDVG